MSIVNFTHHRPSSKMPELGFASIAGIFDKILFELGCDFFCH